MVPASLTFEEHSAFVTELFGMLYLSAYFGLTRYNCFVYSADPCIACVTHQVYLYGSCKIKFIYINMHTYSYTHTDTQNGIMCTEK
jgi:hypothetical protein